MPNIDKPRYLAEVQVEFDDEETAKKWVEDAEESAAKVNGDLYDSSVFDYSTMAYLEQ